MIFVLCTHICNASCKMFYFYTLPIYIHRANMINIVPYRLWMNKVNNPHFTFTLTLIQVCERERHTYVICLFVFLKMSLSFSRKKISVKFQIIVKFGIFMLEIQRFFGEKKCQISNFFSDFFFLIPEFYTWFK